MSSSIEDPEKAFSDKDVEPDYVSRGVHSPEASASSYSGMATHIPDQWDNSKWWGRALNLNNRFETKLGIESRGIERVPSDARGHTRLSANTDIWLAANTVLPTFGIGILGPAIFELGLGDSMLTIFFANACTAMLPAMMATFGPKLGLRQMTSTRYSWGWYGAKVVALLNCIACVGWSTINCIAGAQTLRVVADETISHAVGVVIIAVCTLVLGFGGYKFVHYYERWSWIPTAITFIILLGVSAKHLVNTPMGVGQAEAASVLSMFGTCFGFAAGWVSLASDYNVYLPEDAPAKKVFAWTYVGLIFPLVLVEWLGAAIMCAAVTIPDWEAGYTNNELGGLLGAVLIPSVHNFGKFLMVVLVLSVVANNIINVYSMGMSVSVIGTWLAVIPRWVWPLVITAIYIPLAIVGADSFSSSLENFMNVLGYWLAIYVTVVLEEHFIFKKGNFKNYNVAVTWNKKSALPIGIAGVAAGCCGVAGAVLGMAQTWYIGPIGKLVGGSADPYGGDIGFELAAAFTGVMYPPLRLLELKYFGR